MQVNIARTLVLSLWLFRHGRGAEYCDQPLCVSVCVSVCVCLSVRERISGTVKPILTKFCALIPCGRGSVLLWRRFATLCTSVVGRRRNVEAAPCSDGHATAWRYRGEVWCLWMLVDRLWYMKHWCFCKRRQQLKLTPLMWHTCPLPGPQPAPAAVPPQCGDLSALPSTPSRSLNRPTLWYRDHVPSGNRQPQGFRWRSASVTINFYFQLFWDRNPNLSVLRGSAR